MKIRSPDLRSLLRTCGKQVGARAESLRHRTIVLNLHNIKLETTAPLSKLEHATPPNFHNNIMREVTPVIIFSGYAQIWLHQQTHKLAGTSSIGTAREGIADTVACVNSTRVSCKERRRRQNNTVVLYLSSSISLSIMPIEDAEKIVRKEPLEQFYDVGSELGR